MEPFVDIHCHLLPGIDDGAVDWQTSLTMADMAAADGTRTMIVTPHQLGGFAANKGDMIRDLTAQFQQALDANSINLQVLPGGDVRIDEGLVEGITSGEVMSLADQRRHILLELPHEMYMPLEPLIDRLRGQGVVGVLSHPERNMGLLRDPSPIGPLVERGCLMQVTAGSITGSFGDDSRRFAEYLLDEGLVHFVASDAHGIRSRRPLLSKAFDLVAKRCSTETALELFCRNGARIAAGQDVPRTTVRGTQRGFWGRLFSGRRAS